MVSDSSSGSGDPNYTRVIQFKKKKIPNYFQIVASYGVVMRPGEMREPMTQLSGLIPVSGSLCLLCCVFRERGVE